MRLQSVVTPVRSNLRQSKSEVPVKDDAQAIEWMVPRRMAAMIVVVRSPVVPISMVALMMPISMVALVMPICVTAMMMPGSVAIAVFAMRPTMIVVMRTRMVLFPLEVAAGRMASISTPIALMRLLGAVVPVSVTVTIACERYGGAAEKRCAENKYDQPGFHDVSPFL